MRVGLILLGEMTSTGKAESDYTVLVLGRIKAS